MPNYTRPETIALHSGGDQTLLLGSVAVPIYQTTSYQFNDTDMLLIYFH